MPYNHGVRVIETPTSVAAPSLSSAGVMVVVGTAPINLAEDPSKTLNTPILVNSFEEAKKALGYSDDFDNYTLCEAVDATFRVAGAGPMVLINVLDITTHKAAVTAKAYTPSGGQCKLDEKGMIASSITVTVESTAKVAGTDYVVSFDDDGYCIVTFLTTAPSSATIGGDKLTPSAITSSAIIGSVNVSTGAESGLEVIRQVFPKLGLVPGLIVAPKFSSDASVAAAMAAKCEGINGVFRCECIVDLDSSASTGATLYSNVGTVKTTKTLNSHHMDVVWPCVKIGSKIYHGSSIKAAYTVLSDAENDGVPYISPSNIPVAIDGICTEAGTEVLLDEQQANIVNGYGVNTFNSFNGWRLWGNRTAVYPESADVKDTWFCCRRFFSWWANSFILNYHERVDNPANFRLIEAIVDDENVRGNSLVAEGRCAGAYIEFRGEANSIDEIMGGKLQFYQHLAPFTPAEDILNVLEFDPDLLAAAFTGGE